MKDGKARPKPGWNGGNKRPNQRPQNQRPQNQRPQQQRPSQRPNGQNRQPTNKPNSNKNNSNKNNSWMNSSLANYNNNNNNNNYNNNYKTTTKEGFQTDASYIHAIKYRVRERKPIRELVESNSLKSYLRNTRLQQNTLQRLPPSTRIGDLRIVCRSDWFAPDFD